MLLKSQGPAEEATLWPPPDVTPGVTKAVLKRGRHRGPSIGLGVYVQQRHHPHKNPQVGTPSLQRRKLGPRGRHFLKAPPCPKGPRHHLWEMQQERAGKSKAVFAIKAAISGCGPRKVPGAGAWQSDGESKQPGRIQFSLPKSPGRDPDHSLLCLSRDAHVTAPRLSGEGGD